jgi:class 3 adenylate cyclase
MIDMTEEPGGATRSGGAGTSATRGFLFADLRGYTDFVERHGAARAAALLERYRSMVRSVVAEYRGSEVKTEGDSFFIVLPSASAAVGCAVAIQEAARTADPDEDPIRVGIGIHAGETFELEGGYVGSAVNIAARLCALARPGETLVTETVRELARSVVTTTFLPRGERTLKGVGGRVRVYALAGGAGTVEHVGGRVRRRVSLGRLPAPALLVAALVALVLIVVPVAGLVGRPPPTATPPAATASPSSASSGASQRPNPSAFPNEDEARLISRLPPSIRSCVRGPDPGTTETASLQCALPPEQDPAALRILWFWDSPDGAKRWVDDLIAKRDLKPGDCSTGGEATELWSIASEPQGSVACFEDSTNQSWLSWSQEPAGIVGTVYIRGAAGSKLYAWWVQWRGALVGPSQSASP